MLLSRWCLYITAFHSYRLVFSDYAAFTNNHNNPDNHLWVFDNCQ